MRYVRRAASRTGAHMARWQAYQASLSREQRRELAQAQDRKAARLSRWPHV